MYRYKIVQTVFGQENQAKVKHATAVEKVLKSAVEIVEVRTWTHRMEGCHYQLFTSICYRDKA